MNKSLGRKGLGSISTNLYKKFKGIFELFKILGSQTKLLSNIKNGAVMC